MFNILCLITVTIMVPSHKFQGRPLMITQYVLGKVMSQTESDYTVDFSVQAKKYEYIGEYKGLQVSRTLCQTLP